MGNEEHSFGNVSCVNFICYVCYLMEEGYEVLTQHKTQVLWLRMRQLREVK